MSEWNLSDKSRDPRAELLVNETNPRPMQSWFLDKDVKEFIRQERKILYAFFKSWGIDEDVIQSVIVSLDKLAGESLCAKVKDGNTS